MLLTDAKKVDLATPLYRGGLLIGESVSPQPQVIDGQITTQNLQNGNISIRG
jgi:hypothetical protein